MAEPSPRASNPPMAEPSPRASNPSMLATTEPRIVPAPPIEVPVAAAAADAWDASPGVASVKPRRSRAILIVLLLLLLGGAAAAFVVLRAPKDDKPIADPIAKVEPTSDPEPKPDPNEPKPDPKPEPVVARDAGVTSDPAPPKPAPPTIGALVEREDWIGATRLCATTKSPTRGDQVSCGVAFCRAKKLPLAKRYYQLAQGDERATIEGACKTAGLALVTPQPPPPTRPPTVTKPPRPPKPPAGDPCESMADPLKCQK
jgi:hypothetical protein